MGDFDPARVELLHHVNHLGDAVEVLAMHDHVEGERQASSAHRRCEPYQHKSQTVRLKAIEMRSALP